MLASPREKMLSFGFCFFCFLLRFSGKCGCSELCVYLNFGILRSRGGVFIFSLRLVVGFFTLRVLISSPRSV